MCVFTSAEHRQDEHHQVRSTTGAEHAGKHQEDRTSGGGGQGSAHHTHSWNRCESASVVNYFMYFRLNVTRV